MHTKRYRLLGFGLLGTLSACSINEKNTRNNGSEDQAGPGPGQGSYPIETFDFPGKKSGPDPVNTATKNGDAGGSTTAATSSSTPSQDGAKQTSSSVTTSSTPTPSMTSDTGSGDSSSQEPDPEAKDSGYLEGEPGEFGGEQPKFVDLGVFLVQKFDSGGYRESMRWQNNREEHQTFFLGNERVHMPSTYKIAGNIIRRSYVIFDVSSVKTAKSAELQIFVWNKSKLFNGYGVYSSRFDPYEEFSLYSLDTVTPKEILDAPFGDKKEHSFDVKASQDLGEGTRYATVRITPKIYEQGMSPNASAVNDKLMDCSQGNNACGKWIRIPLSKDAVDRINGTKGFFGMGASLDSVDHGQAVSGLKFGKDAKEFNVREWLFNGSYCDLDSKEESLYPDFLSPQPRLRVRYE